MPMTQDEEETFTLLLPNNTSESITFSFTKAVSELHSNKLTIAYVTKVRPPKFLHEIIRTASQYLTNNCEKGQYILSKVIDTNTPDTFKYPISFQDKNSRKSLISHLLNELENIGFDKDAVNLAREEFGVEKPTDFQHKLRQYIDENDAIQELFDHNTELAHTELAQAAKNSLYRAKNLQSLKTIILEQRFDAQGDLDKNAFWQSQAFDNLLKDAQQWIEPAKSEPTIDESHAEKIKNNVSGVSRGFSSP